MAVLLALATVGAVIRHWSPKPSLAYDIGTLMLVLWLPAVGNLIAFLIREGQLRFKQRTGFDGRPAFTRHVSAQLVAVPERAWLVQSLAPDDARCTLVIGSDGFSARTQAPLREVLTLARAATGGAAALELLKPHLAMPRLVPGAHFHLVVGDTAVAEGTVMAA